MTTLLSQIEKCLALKTLPAEDLSLSDTRLYGSFILEGKLKKLRRVAKLNLDRTAVDEEALLDLALPALYRPGSPLVVLRMGTTSLTHDSKQTKMNVTEEPKLI